MSAASTRSPMALFTWLLFGLLMVLATVGAVRIMVPLVTDGRVLEGQGITDLGRDLAGVAAIRDGEHPYGVVSELLERHGPLDLPQSGPPRATGLVVHPPVAIAGARASSAFLGISDTEMAVRRAGVAAVVLLSVLLGLAVAVRDRRLGLAAAWATMVWAPTITDTVWIQTNAVAGLGVLGVLTLDRTGRSLPARALLGLLVAWKPWLAVLALGLPESRSAVRDLAVVAGWAAGLTVVASFFAGGLETLWIWLTEALPLNNVEARMTPSNLSWTSALGSTTATAAYVAAVGGVGVLRRRLDRALWPLLALAPAITLAPFVWDHYWLALAPAVWWSLGRVHALSRRSIEVVALGWLCLLALPVALAGLGLAGMENRALPVALAPIVLLAGVAWISRSRQRAIAQS